MNVLSDDLILLRIFSYFGIKKLASLATVCKKWQALIKEAIANRKCNIEIKLFQEGDWNFSHGDHGLKDLSIEKKNFQKAFSGSLENLQTEPAIFIYALTEDFFTFKQNTDNTCIIKSPEFTIDSKDHPEINRRKNIEYTATAISECLPRNSIKLVLSMDSFIFTNLKTYSGNDYEEPESLRALLPFISPSIQSSAPHNPAILSLLLPKSVDYRFNVVQLISETQKLDDLKNEQDLLRFFGVKSDEALRMIIIFDSDFFGNIKSSVKRFYELINKIRSKKSKNSKNDMNNLVVVGNSVHDAFTNKKNRNYQYINDEITFLTLICKKNKQESVKIAQMIMTERGDDYYDEYFEENSSESENDEEASNFFNQKLDLIRNTFIGTDPARNRFALLNTPSHSEAVAKLYQNHFPDLPIVGLIGHHKVGHDFFPLNQLCANQLDRNPPPKSKINYDVTLYEQGQYDCSVFTVIDLL